MRHPVIKNLGAKTIFTENSNYPVCKIYPDGKVYNLEGSFMGKFSGWIRVVPVFARKTVEEANRPDAPLYMERITITLDRAILHNIHPPIPPERNEDRFIRVSLPLQPEY